MPDIYMVCLMVFVYILILLFGGMKRQTKVEAKKKTQMFHLDEFCFFFSFIFQAEMNYYHFNKCVCECASCTISIRIEKI